MIKYLVGMFAVCIAMFFWVQHSQKLKAQSIAEYHDCVENGSEYLRQSTLMGRLVAPDIYEASLKRMTENLKTKCGDITNYK